MRSTSSSRRAPRSSSSRPGFTFTEGPIWHPGEQVLYFSDMPGDIRRKVTLDGTVTEVRNPSFKCNGMTLDADLNLLVCEHVTSSLVRERPDGVRETLAFHYEGKYLNSPNDVTVRSDGTIYFSDPWYGRFPGFGIERARELGLAGRVPDPAGWRPGRARPRRRAGRVRDAERPLLLTRRVAALRQRHPAGVHQGLRRERRRHARERPHVLRRRRHGRDRGGHPRRDEVRRAGQHLGHGPGRRLGDLAGRRAPRHDPRPRERRQPHLGRAGLAHAVHPARPVPSTRSARSSARAASRTCARRSTCPSTRWTRGAAP